ncbi:EAL domain-containing protein [Bradyrhizobium sp.]|uniref:bifunctional diguanylate cyclase/phosphodiesterase n=1 Tax=Bradyrhizobium sp. TaxID=376 RepID=UPI001DCAD93A|nr:EAL domain-containing protein [Bradyrhizobium sp.]MBI5321953.1 EAL domain-containing protein [Bradyrhizobium sp.]
MTDFIRSQFRMRRDPIRWLAVCGTLLILAIVGATAIMVSHFRERALDSSRRQLESTVLLLAEHFDQQLRDLTAIQDDVVTYMEATGIDSAEHYVRRMSSPDIHLMLKTRIGALSYVGSVNLFDSDGKLINSSTAWPIPDLNAGDRKFFKTFKSGSQSPSAVVELVQSRISGVRTTVIARKLTDRNGEFMGVIGRGVEAAHYEKFFASVALGKETAITMFQRDGTLLARYPRLDSMVGHNFRHGAMFKYVLSQNGNATGLFQSPINGEDRIGSARALQNFPIFVMATTTVAAALADWRQQTRLLVGAAVLATLVIATTLFLIVRQLSRQHRLEKHRLNTAVDNMRQGLLLFDSSQRLVVCNERYIEMFGLSPDVVKPGCSLRDLISHRKETGSLKEDVDEHCALVQRNAALNNVIVTETTDGRLIQTAYRSVAGGGWVTTLEDITERQRAEDRIAHLAHYDSLTDLPNRVLFRERLEQELRAIEHGNRFAVLLIDIDEFKGINDSLGHAIGDELLKSVATRLRECVGSDSFVARLGGDEFAVLQPLVLDTGEATELVTEIHAAIREPHACLGHQISIDASIGIAMAPKDGCHLDELLKNADLAMYDAKSAGRHTWRFFAPEMDKRAKSRRVMEEELRQIVAEGAFTEGGFEVHYQPLVSLQSGDVTGCEALLRWRHPERGMISPVDFIPVAEDTGLIDQLGEWVLATACNEAASWPDGIKVAVNVSPVQFRKQTLPLKVAAALANSSFAATRLELEITEAVLIRDDEAALAILEQLRSLGVRIALDDFGTGYSSLSYLQRFPFDKIKIDRSFVKDIANSKNSASIVQAVVSIAGVRGITTTVEGVETEEQRDQLRKLGCVEMQGYLFSPARPAADIRKLLGSQRAERATA